MKNKKICPKCGSDEILRFNGETDNLYGGIMPGTTIFSAVAVDRFVCCNCGFVEHWVRKGDIEKLRKSKKAKKI